MSIDPSNVAQTTATATIATTTITTTSTTTAAASLPSSSSSSIVVGGAEEEEESTLVEISASSSSSSPTTVSSLSPSSRTTSSTTGGDNDGPESSHPEEAARTVRKSTTTKPMMTISREDATAASLDSSEASTVALVADLTPQQQQQPQQPTLAPVAAHVATDLPIIDPEQLQQQQQQQPRNLFPIQSSSSLSTPSSSEEYDVSVNTSSTEGALNVSSSNNQLNNNNDSSSTAIGSNNNNNNTSSRSGGDQHQQEVAAAAAELSSIESALPPLLPPLPSTPTLVTSTPENSPSSSKSEEQQQHRQAPIEIVQIFPSTAKTLSSSVTSSSSSPSSPSPGSSSSSSTGTSSASSTSSSPSVSPLAVDQQQQQQSTAATAATSAAAPQVRAEVPPSSSSSSKMDDSAICEPEISDPQVVKPDQEVPQKRAAATLAYHSRTSRSSPQLLQSSLKKYKMGERSSETRRRVSFPKDAQLITGYLEPIDPWACVTIISVPELTELYQKSCTKHFTEPLPVITQHLTKLDLAANQRIPLLSLKDQNLSHGSCEALEEIFKRVQYRSINLSNAGLDDTSASVLFDMIEYYEAANELDISDNLAMTNKSWLAAINMVKKSQSLKVLVTRGPGISDYNATSLAKALNTSALHTLRLEHCELSQRPLASLCNLLKRNTVLRELSLAHNQLTCDDAKNIANLVRSNYYIQLLDISNNNIGDKGVEYIVSALIDQSIYFKTVQETKRKSEFSFADLSSSLHNINSNKHYFPNPYGKTSHQRLSHSAQQLSPTPTQHHHQDHQHQHQSKLSESSLAGAMSPTPLAMMGAAVDETPKTPPPTPALPMVRTPSTSGEVPLVVATSLPPPVETQEEEPPPSPPRAATTALEESSDMQEKSTNNDSGLNSSVSSEADQTNSDSSASVVASTAEVQQQSKTSGEEPVVTTTVGDCETTTSDISGDNLVDSGLGVCDQPDNSRTDSASDLEGSVVEANVVTTTIDAGDAGEKQTLELAFDLGGDGDELDVKGPKKARLAKQDSILSEFESSMPELLPLLKTDIPKTRSIVSKAEEPMEEDTPEICADYDDSNLKIVEENLLVDRSINATNSEPNDTKEAAEKTNLKVAHTAPSYPTDNDDSAPVTPLATHKKDELQLLLEKSKQQEEQEEESIDPPPLIEPVSPGPSVEVTTSISVPENLATIPLKIVEGGDLKDKPLSRSLDSAGSADFDSPFLGGNQPPAFPNERSFSSESLNSETSVDSNDSKSSLKIIESKFAARNGTLERQQSNANREAQQADQSSNTPCGLQVLVLWNNEITRNAAQTFSDLIENTSTLEILNVGCNLLCNDFVASIKGSLKSNSSVTSLGLQGAHLSDNGAKVMAEVIEFGGNATLQRIDLRNNNILATGLDHLNEAMKSNKTVTRIDLDDVPRRMVGNSLDIGPEYARLLNNIRAQCERNKHPQEPSEPISTSIKRLRGSHLNSRKISLTCSSIRTAPSSSGGTTAGEKHHHHLLDPTKKTGGRLRSPLPSPIPSPIASPVPSPSRNRFQVTRVGESTGSTSSLTSMNTTTSNTSTSPSPSSTGSSPTLFFAANSRFRVVTVEEPASASSSSSSVPNYPLGKLSSSSISPSPLVTSGISRMPPSGSSSAPALSSFVSSPKLTSSPIQQQQQSVATNTPLPSVLVQHQQLPHPTPVQQPQPSPPPQPQQHPQTQLPPASSVPPTTPKPKHTRLPSTSSTLNDSVISSTSIESPDLEVKRFMTGGAAESYPSTTGHTRTHSSTMDDSCCSSISSSIDSIDNVHLNNTSISSTDESFDLIVSSPSSSSISIGSVSTAPLVKSTSSQQGDITLIPQKQQQQHQHQQKPQQSNPTIKEPPSLLVNASLLKVKNNSLSSLEMSTSSQESLYDVQDLSSVSISSSSGGGSSSLVGGVVAARCLALPGAGSSGNSNENTLTSIQSLDKDIKPAAAGKSTEKPPRVRKTSWISSIGGSHPKADSGSTGSTGGGNSSGTIYSPAIEKLLSIFSPNLFSSNKSSPPSSECGTATTGGGGSGSTAAKENTSSSSSQPPSRKESPMGGLFAWTKSSKDEDKVLKANVSPENTITPQHQVSYSQQSPQLPAFSVDNIPSQLKAEIKENISPENTITNKLLVSPPPPSAAQVMTTPVSTAAVAAPPVATAAGSPHPKVIFHLGGDYEDSEDDIDTLTSKFGGGSGGGTGGGNPLLSHPPLSSSILGTSAGSTTTNSSGISIGSNMAEGSPTPSSGGSSCIGVGGISILQTSHLGQLARDSLTTMFKNSSLTSQDSIRSMDSLAEMTETLSSSSQHPTHQQPQQQHQQLQHHQQPDDTQAQ